MPDPHYETSDKYLAAFLLCQDAALLGQTRVSRRRVSFRFRADRRLHESLCLYRYLAPVTMVPLHFVAALRRLRRIARGCK